MFPHTNKHYALFFLQDPFPSTESYSLFSDRFPIHQNKKSELMQTGDPDGDILFDKISRMKESSYLYPSQKNIQEKSVASPVKSVVSSVVTTPISTSSISKLIVCDMRESDLTRMTTVSNDVVTGGTSCLQRDDSRHHDVINKVRPGSDLPLLLGSGVGDPEFISDDESNQSETKENQNAQDCQAKLHSKQQSRSESSEQTDQERRKAMSSNFTRQDCSSGDAAAHDRTIDLSLLVASSSSTSNDAPQITSHASVTSSSNCSDDTSTTKLDWAAQKKALIRDALNEIE